MFYEYNNGICTSENPLPGITILYEVVLATILNFEFLLSPLPTSESPAR